MRSTRLPQPCGEAKSLDRGSLRADVAVAHVRVKSMYLPVSKILLLVLLVVFFGVQQRSRPQLYYRFWFVGWVCILMSYAVWMLPFDRQHVPPFQEALRFDLLYVGALAFLKSFLASTRSTRRTAWSALSIALPAIVGFDLQQMAQMPKWLLLLGILLGQAAAIRAVLTMTPRGWTRIQPALLGTCVVCGFGMLVYLRYTAGDDLGQLVLAQLMLCNSLLSLGMYPIRNAVGFLGMLGFFAWGSFYAATTIFPGGGTVMRTLSEFWEFPKYFVGFAMILRIFDDTAEERAWEAQHDELTGLPNRLLLRKRMEQTMAQCLRSNKIAALLTIDIDHFKRVNDTYGHPVGDACLRVVAARLNSKIRQVDILARTGGEEFTGMIGGLTSKADAEMVTTTLLKLFEEPLHLPDLDLPVTVSIGVALFPDDAEGADTLRKMSDEALYHAKRTGRNRIAFAPAGAAEQTEIS